MPWITACIKWHLCLNFHNVTSVRWTCLSWEVCRKRKWCTCLNVKVQGSRWHIGQWIDGEAEDIFPQGTKCSRALCPMYTVSSITSIYTPHHWKVSALGWYIDSTDHYLCFLPIADSQACPLRQHQGNTTHCYEPKETHDLRRDLHIRSMSLCMLAQNPGMCAMEREWGSRDKGEKDQ